MTLSRLTTWTFLIAAGFALLSGTARAQDPPFPTKSNAYNKAVGMLNEYKAAPRLDPNVLPTAREHFKTFADYYALMVAHPLIYRAMQDPSIKAPMDRAIPPLDGDNGLFREIQRFILEPSLQNVMPNGGVGRGQADYIREFGAAFDAALKPIIETHPDRIVRLNALRMLAVVCKGGASAHYPTIKELIATASTPPEIKNHAFQAAANLLSTYDVIDVASRRHSIGWKNDQQKGAGDQELAELVGAIEKCVLDPATLMADPKWKPGDPNSEEVVRFIRRQAVKALAQVRFVAITRTDGTMIYPANTLARVCVSDPAVFPTIGLLPSPSECAEAAIGLCNMAPVKDKVRLKEYNETAAVEAVTAALVTFAGPRAEKLEDQSLPWRGYGLRLTEAFRNWRPLWDAGFNPLKPGANLTPPPPVVNDLIQRAQVALLTPLDKVGSDGKPDLVAGRVNIEGLKDFLKQLRESKTRDPHLFIGNKATALPIPDRK
jgi:hypothetical protein